MLRKKNIKVDKTKKIEQNLEEDFVPEDDSLGFEEKLKRVQKKLKECEKERKEYLDGWQRARADAINREKQHSAERSRAISRAQDDIFTKLFPILDSFDMAFSNKEVWERVDEGWRVGVEHIHTQFIQTLEEAGISAIDTIGAFDPHVHEPVETEMVQEKEKDNTVLKVLQKGYRNKERVLRPAKIVIGVFSK